MVDIIQVLKDDYQRFPLDQTYSIYARDVYFKDPLTAFRGVGRYRLMISFLRSWFLHPKLDLHHISRSGSQITTRWTLSGTTPLPWKPHIVISGWSELQLNGEELIVSHVDHWNCSRLEVLQQHFARKKAG